MKKKKAGSLAVPAFLDKLGDHGTGAGAGAGAGAPPKTVPPATVPVAHVRAAAPS